MEDILGKARRGHKEYSRERLLTHQNRALKREVASLRKQLARLDLDRLTNVKDVIEKSYKKEEEQVGIEIVEKLQQEWKCKDCSEGYLEICIYNRPDATWYYRQCNHCTNRTKSQRYEPGKVKGIIKDSNKE